MSLLSDWKSYVDEPSRFNKHHFESLMLELESEKSLREAFVSLPGGQDFVDRILDLRSRAASNGTYLFGKATKVEEADYKLVKIYRDVVVDHLRDIGDPDAATISDQPIDEISQEEYHIKKRAGELGLLQIMWNIDDAHVDAISEQPKWAWGLYEAVNMMTTIPEVTRHLLSPIIPYSLDENSAFELWLRGHRIDFCNRSTLLIVAGS